MSDFNKLENKIIVMENKLDTLTGRFDEYHKDNKEAHLEFAKLVRELNEKKADKSVVEEIRNDLKKVVWIVLSAVILGILSLIIKGNV
jgi:regulator of replication initiation timing